MEFSHDPLLLAGLAAAVGLAGHPAAAADLVAGAPPAVNAPVPLPTWSGFYLGAGLGGRWADAEWTTTALGEGPTATVPLTTGNPASFDLSGSRISVFLGHNWQISNWVLGVEADSAGATPRSAALAFPVPWPPSVRLWPRRLP